MVARSSVSAPEALAAMLDPSMFERAFEVLHAPRMVGDGQKASHYGPGPIRNVTQFTSVALRAHVGTTRGGRR